MYLIKNQETNLVKKILFILMLIISCSVHANDWEDARAAFEKKDYKMAFLKFKAVMDQEGDAAAQYNLAYLYEEGLGTLQNYSEALRLYKLAASQDYPPAQSNLGSMYGRGRGVPQNYSEAARWYALAAAQGLAIAQYNLGHMYDNGEGVERSYAKAVRWYRLAAEQGDIGAQSNLGNKYYLGQGLVQDYIRAHMWWNIAASQGYDVSIKNRDIVAAKMTQQQIAEAQRLARECFARDFKKCD